MSFDPKSFNTDLADDGVWFDVLDPDGEPVIDEASGERVRLKLRGSHSAEVKAVERRNQIAGIKAMRKSGDAGIEQMVDRGEQSKFEVAVAATIDWDHIGDASGDLPCNEVNARKVYKAAQWLALQASNNVYDDKSFTSGSAKA